VVCIEHREFRNLLVSKYNINEIATIQKVGGNTNQNYLVAGPSQRYILRVSNPAKTEQELAFETSVLDQLANELFVHFVAKPVPDVRGSKYSLAQNGALVTLFQFVEDESNGFAWNPSHPDKEFLEDLARKTAILHRSLALCRPEGQKASLAEKFRRYKGGPYFVDILDGENLVHTDLRIKNLVFRSNKVKTILDFDDMTHGNQLYDLAKIIKENFALRQDSGGSPLPHFNLDAASAFLKTYQELNGRVDTEKIYELMKACIVHVLNFLEGDNPLPHEQREFIQKLNILQMDYLGQAKIKNDIMGVFREQ